MSEETIRTEKEVFTDLLAVLCNMARTLGTIDQLNDHTTKSINRRYTLFVHGLLDGYTKALVPYPISKLAPFTLPVMCSLQPTFEDGFKFGEKLRMIEKYAVKHGLLPELPLNFTAKKVVENK